MVLGAIRGGFENIMFNFGEPVFCWSLERHSISERILSGGIAGFGNLI